MVPGAGIQYTAEGSATMLPKSSAEPDGVLCWAIWSENRTSGTNCFRYQGAKP